MTAAQAAVLAVIYLCGLVFLIVAVARLRKRYESGVIHGPDLCYSYPYTMGDNLGWNRHGLDVWLPENLPEFYIVSYASKSVKGATYVLKSAWRIELEGEFGQKFGVYIPCNNAAEVLSIITPDVMRSLLAYAQDFDIHVEGGTMHVISRWRVYENSKRKQQLLLAAHSFVAEIDHKLKSWSPHTQTNVRMVKGLEGSLMLGGRKSIGYISLWSSAMTLPFALVLWFFGIYMYVNNAVTLAQSLILFVVGFGIFPIVYLLLVRMMRNMSQK